MAQRIRDRKPRAPAQRLRDREDDGYFYPREIVEMLELADVDYHQLRRLFEVVRKQAGTAIPEGWSRYSLLDIAALKILIDLCGGVSALQRGRRLRVGPVDEACQALRRQGFDNPLLDVRMMRDGDRVFAAVDASVLDPVSGQTALAEVLPLAEKLAAEGSPLRDQLQAEEQRQTPSSDQPTVKTALALIE
jgi:hypothetical protein